jgi:hypothetical protein
MNCPACRQRLPFSFALATVLTIVVCRRCRAELRPTAESADRVARKIFMPSARVGAVVSALGTWYGLTTGRWAPLLWSLGIAVGVSFAASWWLATRRIVFERA